MTEHPSAKSETLPQSNFVFPPQRYSIEYAKRMRGARSTTVGTPEHAALIAAVRRNFPEIYDWKKDDAADEGQLG